MTTTAARLLTAAPPALPSVSVECVVGCQEYESNLLPIHDDAGNVVRWERHSPAVLSISALDPKSGRNLENLPCPEGCKPGDRVIVTVARA